MSDKSDTERTNFIRAMARVSPLRAAVMKNLEQFDACVDQGRRDGYPAFSCDTTHALGHAAIERLADMVDQGVPNCAIAAAMEIAFSNALSAVISLLAVNMRLDDIEFADDVCGRVIGRTMENVAETARRRRTGR